MFFLIIFKNLSSQKVNCLSVSLDDFTLASGSSDCTIRIWDTYSRQCIKVINQNGNNNNNDNNMHIIYLYLFI